MRVQVRLFAILKDRAGFSEMVLELPEGTTAGGAAEALVRMYPALREPVKRAAYAVNRSYCSASDLLSDGDELALIPPVSGG
jgi:molybdopterin converting factor subunit 1